MTNKEKWAKEWFDKLEAKLDDKVVFRKDMEKVWQAGFDFALETALNCEDLDYLVHFADCNASIPEGTTNEKV